MDHTNQSLYYKGYIAGYRDGIIDAANGKVITEAENDLTLLPMKAMGISTRAYNILRREGCVYIKDVMELNDHRIATMRSLGPVIASEIARWFDAHGICYTAWNHYL